MRPWCHAVVIALAMITVKRPAIACIMAAPRILDDIQYADVVVIGRISNYQIIRDVAFRRQMLANPNLRADLRRIYEEPDGTLMSDYARFDVRPSQIVKGKAPTTIVVTWDHSTFDEPDQMAPGPYLIALRDPQSNAPPLRGPSASISPSKEPGTLTVLQAPCAPPFIIPLHDPSVESILKRLKGRL
jgi:hypothetical protein